MRLWAIIGPTVVWSETLDTGQAFFPEAPQLLAVQDRQVGELPPPQRGEDHPLTPVIVGVRDPRDQPAAFGPVYQFDRGMVAEFHPVRDFSDGRGLGRVGAADGQQKLVL